MPKLSWLGLMGNPCCPLANGLMNRERVPTISIDNFEIIRKVGEGTSGIVSEARNKVTNEIVALKVFKALRSSDRTVHDEIKSTVASGSHESLLTVLGVLDSLSKPGIIFNLVDSSYVGLGNPPSFDTVTRDTYDPSLKFALKVVLEVLCNIASACEHIHARGISHGDIYAHNILIDKEHKRPTLLCDFGAATVYAAVNTGDRNSIGSFEPLEVRAFACLMEELLLRVTSEQPSNAELTIISALLSLREKCTADETHSRPTFAIISKHLQYLRNELNSVSKGSRVLQKVLSSPLFFPVAVACTAVLVVALFRIFNH